MKDEILYISGSQEDADYWLKKIAKRLHLLKIDFKLNIRKSKIETEKYNIYGLSIYGNCLSLRNSYTRYYMIGHHVDSYMFDNIFHFKQGTEELHHFDEIIEIVR